MTVPNEYRQASSDFDHLLAEIADKCNLSSRHQAYTVAQAVLICLRRRMSLPEAIIFAQMLPVLARALFIENWNPLETPVADWDPERMTEEILSLRRHHNLADAQSLANVIKALGTAADRQNWSRGLPRLSPALQALLEADRALHANASSSA